MSPGQTVQDSERGGVDLCGTAMTCLQSVTQRDDVA